MGTFSTRERPRQRIAKRLEAPQGMAPGTLNVGDRTPVEEIMAWVTLEVVHRWCCDWRTPAGGETLEHEHRLLNELLANRGG